MNLPLHLFRLQPAPTQRDSETIHIVPRHDLQWDLPTFKAPTLPTLHQLHSDVPFFVNFRVRDRQAR